MKRNDYKDNDIINILNNDNKSIVDILVLGVIRLYFKNDITNSANINKIINIIDYILKK